MIQSKKSFYIKVKHNHPSIVLNFFWNSDIYTDKTAATFSVHRPTAKLITFPKLSQKREEGEKRKKQVYTLLYKRIHGENSGDNIVEYQQLKCFIVQVVAILLCKLWHFHYADCGIFIMQVEDFSIAV